MMYHVHTFEGEYVTDSKADATHVAHVYHSHVEEES